jgi:hypothetical protein
LPERVYAFPQLELSRFGFFQNGLLAALRLLSLPLNSFKKNNRVNEQTEIARKRRLPRTDSAHRHSANSRAAWQDNCPYPGSRFEVLGNRRSRTTLHRPEGFPMNVRSIASLAILAAMLAGPGAMAQADPQDLKPNPPVLLLESKQPDPNQASPCPSCRTKPVSVKTRVPSKLFQNQIHPLQRRSLRRQHRGHASDPGSKEKPLVVRNRSACKTFCSAPRIRLLRQRPGDGYWAQLVELENGPLASLAQALPHSTTPFHRRQSLRLPFQ